MPSPCLSERHCKHKSLRAGLGVPRSPGRVKGRGGQPPVLPGPLGCRSLEGVLGTPMFAGKGVHPHCLAVQRDLRV